MWGAFCFWEAVLKEAQKKLLKNRTNVPIAISRHGAGFWDLVSQSWMGETDNAWPWKQSRNGFCLSRRKAEPVKERGKERGHLIKQWAVSLEYDLRLVILHISRLLLCQEEFTVVHLASPGHCSWGGNECFQGPERGIHGYHRVPGCSSASLLADLDHHCCGKELHHCLPIAHKHAAGPHRCQSLGRVGGER